MALEKFDLASLATIDDGRIAATFLYALQRCESDCKDRPALKDARKINLSMSMKPVCDEQGELSSVIVMFEVKDSQPKRSSKAYEMKATTAGLLFNELSSDDVHQATLDEAADRMRIQKEEAHAS